MSNLFYTVFNGEMLISYYRSCPYIYPEKFYEESFMEGFKDAFYASGEGKNN